MKVYIAGPMSGYADFNFPAFFHAQERWKDVGWDVVNPATYGADHEDAPSPWLEYMTRDIPVLIRCDAIAMLHDWQESRGARIEYAIADLFGLRIFDAAHPTPPPPETHK